MHKARRNKALEPGSEGSGKALAKVFSRPVIWAFAGRGDGRLITFQGAQVKLVAALGNHLCSQL